MMTAVYISGGERDCGGGEMDKEKEASLLSESRREEVVEQWHQTATVNQQSMSVPWLLFLVVAGYHFS
jgi:hypothetical protein